MELIDIFIEQYENICIEHSGNQMRNFANSYLLFYKINCRNSASK